MVQILQDDWPNKWPTEMLGAGMMAHVADAMIACDWIEPENKTKRTTLKHTVHRSLNLLWYFFGEYDRGINYGKMHDKI